MRAGCRRISRSCSVEGTPGTGDFWVTPDGLLFIRRHGPIGLFFRVLDQMLGFYPPEVRVEPSTRILSPTTPGWTGDSLWLPFSQIRSGVVFHHLILRITMGDETEAVFRFPFRAAWTSINVVAAVLDEELGLRLTRI